MTKTIGYVLALVALVPSCPASAAKSQFSRQPYAGAYEPQGADERGMWMELDEGERSLREQPFVLRNADLTAFIKDVLCKTVGADRCDAVRVYVLKDSSFNASMSPNGLMLVHTGLLIRLHSEAELAAVLGHEFAHFERRHTLSRFKSLRATTDAMSWISLAGFVSGQSTTDIRNNLWISHVAFNRENEVEADTLAARFLMASPYRLRGAEVWKHAQEEEDALRVERGLRKLRRLTPGLLDTHPTNSQRMAYFTKLELEAAGAGEDGIDRYRSVTAPLVRELTDPLIKSNEFASTDYVLRGRGEALGWDGQLLQARADLYRLRGYPRDLVTASDLFKQAVARNDAPVEAWRGLGLVNFKLGNADAGRAALGEYLKRAPNAPDAAILAPLMTK